MRSRRSILILGAAGLACGVAFGVMGAVAFAIPSATLAGIPLAAGAAGGAAMAVWAGIQLKRWPLRKLALFRNHLVVIQGKHEVRAIWSLMETVTLAETDAWPDFRITDHLTIHSRNEAPIRFRPAVSGWSATASRRTDRSPALATTSSSSSRLPSTGATWPMSLAVPANFNRASKLSDHDRCCANAPWARLPRRGGPQPPGAAPRARPGPRDQSRAVAERPLEGAHMAMLFQKPSHRTRVSFEVGIARLGGSTTTLSEQDVQLGARESISMPASSTVTSTASSPALRTHEDLRRARPLGGKAGDQRTHRPLAPLPGPGRPHDALEEVGGELGKQHLVYIGDGNNVVTSLVRGQR